MCLDCAVNIPGPEAATAFEDRFVETLNAGALCLMTSVGHRTGLFDAMADAGSVTSQQLAERAGLNERYVREWLGAMVSGGFIAYAPDAHTYVLPAEHAAILTRAAAPNNLATYAQYIAVLGQVEDDIVACFEYGGGVPYERYPRFHEVMAEDSGQTVLPALFDHILPLAPELVANLEDGIEVADVGCGRGRALNLMAQRFPNSRFLGLDLSTEAIAFAQDQAAAQGLDNLHFVAHDLSRFDDDAEPARFDAVFTFDAIHDQAEPMRMLKGIRKSLKPGGIYLAQDIKASSRLENNLDHPIAPLLYTLSTMHCMTVSLAQDGLGLGAMWGRELAQSMLDEAGFTEIEVHDLDHDIQNDYYVCRV